MSVFTRRLTIKGKRQSASVVTYRGPKIAALDYRTSGTGSYDVNVHKKYDISIIGMLTTQAGSGLAGYNFVLALKTANPSIKIFQYTIQTQMFAKQDGFTNYAAISDLLDAGGTTGGSWWAKNATNGLKTKTFDVQSYPAWEVNISTYTTPNASGRRAPQEIARFFSNLFDGLFAVGLTGYFQDNTSGAPGSSTSNQTIDSGGNSLGSMKVGDYNLDGTNDALGLNSVNQRTTSPGPGFRAGHAAYVSELKSLRASTQVIANADFDNRDDPNYGTTCLTSTELNGVYDYAFMEGFVGKSYSLETGRNVFADSYRRYTTSESGTTQGVIVNAYVNTATQSLSRQLQYARYGLAITMLRDGYFCIQDQNTGAPWWFNEIDPAFVPIGNRVGAKPSAAASNGIWMQTYENGCVLVNPVANKGRWMAAVSGSSIKRLSNVVTLVCSTFTGPVVGDKIRITDCVNSAFNGTFTLTGASAGTYTWFQTGADITQINSPAGFVASKSTIDLTGQGYKRFLGTDDAHNDYDNGTSLNDGATAGVEELWSGDGRILLKQ